MSGDDREHKSQHHGNGNWNVRCILGMTRNGTAHYLYCCRSIHDYCSTKNIQKSMTSRTRNTHTGIQSSIDVQTLRNVRTTSSVYSIPTIIPSSNDYKLFQDYRKFLKTLDIWTRNLICQNCLHSPPRFR